jgi:hypothetical protein
VDRTVDGLKTAIRLLLRAADRFLDWTDAFDNHGVFSRVDEGDGAGLALVASGDDLDLVTFFYVSLAHVEMVSVEIRAARSGVLEHFGREGNNFHELFFAELTSDRSKDPGAAWVVVLVDHDDRVGIEAENRAIRATDRISCANNHRLNDASFLDRSGRDGIANVGGDNITNLGGAGALAEHADHFCAARAGVIGDVEQGFHLDHGGKSKELVILGR